MFNKGQLSGLMKQAQAMQDNMKKAQDELGTIDVTGESGAGLVKVTMSCKHEVKRVTIDPSLLAEGFEPDILGLFTGSPYGTELAQDQPAPPEILLYLESLWDYAEGDPAAFREETRLTYLHELGHYLGWDENELAARGLD